MDYDYAALCWDAEEFNIIPNDIASTLFYKYIIEDLNSFRWDMSFPVITITDSAARHVAAMIVGRGKPSQGVRIGVRAAGCSGLSYTLEFVDEIQLQDLVVREKGVIVYVDPKATMFLIGTEMDFEETDLQSGFVFKNPNERARCGCGESFHI